MYWSLPTAASCTAAWSEPPALVAALRRLKRAFRGKSLTQIGRGSGQAGWDGACTSTCVSARLVAFEKPASCGPATCSVQVGEEEILRRELQHRAKNNLSLIIALLGREQRLATAEHDNRTAERLGALMQRVTAIAVAQDWLAVSVADGQAVDLADYLRVLVGKLQLSLGDRLQLETDLSRCIMPFSKAVAAGLLVNELVTNSAKHAYPEECGGLVRLVLRVKEDGSEAALTVSDEGQGTDMAAVAARVAEGGQGLTLVELLSKQLGGDVVRETPEHGTRTTIRFPCVP